MRTDNLKEEIAIIGLGCRFPDAQSPMDFWRLLSEGRKAIKPVPGERWEQSHYYDSSPTAAGKMNSCEGGFLEEIDHFDAAFFGISEAEARHIDPQQRLFLEVAWEALEHASIAPLSLSGSATGVFAGLCTIDYHRLLYRDFEAIGPHSGTGTTMSITANRLSYLLDLRGPSMAVDAACSSSLMGVHLACQSLRTGESDLCIAGGVNLILSPDSMISSSQTGLLSKRGECRPFDANADGYVRGEGCGVVVLKRLSDATANGDNVLAVIKGSAVNQDGLSNSLTAPNGLAQQALIERSLSLSDVAPKDIDYVEAHAVGTQLGDAIEFKALKKVLMKERETPCVVGSLKPNIGHLEAASGMASLIKVVMALQHEEIPPQLNFEQANSYVDLEENTFEITRSARCWARGERPRLAGVSTFGFGGTNAHIVVSEAPSEALRTESKICTKAKGLDALPEQGNNDYGLFVITAKSPTALRSLARRYCEYLSEDCSENARSLIDICYSASTGRTHFNERLCIVTHSIEHLKQQLEQFSLQGHCAQGIAGRAKGRKMPAVVFSFPEFTQQNLAETLTVGEHLYRTQPLFKQSLDSCAQSLGIDALSFIPNGPTAKALGLAIYYASSALWQSWGVPLKAVIGQGDGERIAACVAGLMDLEYVETGNPLTFNLPKTPIVSNQHSPLLAEARGALLADHRPKNVERKFPTTGLIGYSFTLSMGAVNEKDSLSYQPAAIEAVPLRISAQGDIKHQLLSHIGTLFAQGAPIDWAAFYHGQLCRKVPLPTYPFERTSYWFTNQTDSAAIEQPDRTPTLKR